MQSFCLYLVASIIEFNGGVHMDLAKLKLGKLNKIKALNFPNDIDLGVKNSPTPEVIIYFISAAKDIDAFAKACTDAKLPADNRTIMVYKKGNKLLNRDTLISPFKEGKYKEFKLKPPMLCSLSESLSAFVMQKV
jgi:hypothetical protein